MGFKALRWDDDLLAKQPDKEAYINDESMYGTVLFKEKLDPMNSWPVPFVTGHKYKIHWGMVGLDWDSAIADMSERWAETDKSIYLVHNFTDQRAHMDVYLNDVLIENNTIPKLESEYSPG